MKRWLVVLTAGTALVVGACSDDPIEGAAGCDELTEVLNDLLEDPSLDSTEIGDILDSAFIQAIVLFTEAEGRGNPIEMAKCEVLAEELGSVFGALD